MRKQETKRQVLTADEQAELRANGLVADVLDTWKHPGGTFDLIPYLSFEKRRQRVYNTNPTNNRRSA